MARKETHRTTWLKAYLDEGMPTFLNTSASAKAAGYRAKTDDSFRAIGYQNRKKFAPKIAKWLEDHGYSDNQLKIKVLQLMEAKETVFHKLKGGVDKSSLPPGSRLMAVSGTAYVKDGEFIGADGDTLIGIDVENYAVQVKSLDMALKMKGLFAPEKHEHTGTMTTKMELTDEDGAMAQKLIDESARLLMEREHEKPA